MSVVAIPNSATSPSPTRLSVENPPPGSSEVREYSTAAGSSQPVGIVSASGESTYGSGGLGFFGGGGGGSGAYGFCGTSVVESPSFGALPPRCAPPFGVAL